jgi:hypothetical protein
MKWSIRNFALRRDKRFDPTGAQLVVDIIPNVENLGQSI